MLSKPSLGEWFRRLVITALLVNVVAIDAQGVENCPSGFRCDRDCKPLDKCGQPQRCDRECKHLDVFDSKGGGDTIPSRLASVENTVAELKVMIGVLLGLVVLLILAVVILFLHRCNKIPENMSSLVLFRNKKKTPHKIGNGVAANGNVVIANGRVSRIANHHSNSSPQSKRASVNRHISLNTEVETQPRPFRVRQPSESTCPEEVDEIAEPQGYDNLALSTSTINTSTLHNTSDSSSDTLGPTLSTNTLQTTLPSEAPFNSHVHNTQV